MNYQYLKNLLFLLPTETSHTISLQSISLLQQLKLAPLIAREVVHDPVEVMGLKFPNRVGLAAGLDKDARCIDGMAALGFGFLEVGTVTPKPQAGNAKPRLFRLKSERALINRMGFNNEGVAGMAKRIRRSSYDGILGVNIGKNADTPLEDSLQDYEFCLHKVYKVASYVVVNVSSPNTEGLRSLQFGDDFARLLHGLKEAQQRLKEKHGKQVPLVIKIAPDLDDAEISQVAQRLIEFELDGVIVGNTTVARDMLDQRQTVRYAKEQGGLSGEPLRELSDHVLEIMAGHVKAKMAVIGVGGILSGEDAVRKIDLGADLVQIYTGFIYRGPDLVGESARAIAASRHLT